MLVRDFENELQVFLLRRNSRSAFAPDAFVFPGGTMDACDRSETMLERLRLSDRLEPPARVPSELPTTVPPVSSEETRYLLVTAARELLEEAGVALLCDADGRAAAADLVREDIARDASRFAAFLREANLFVDGDRLHRFSHWITPPTEPRRYDTHFFLAAAPTDQTALADAAETHDGVWIAPREALAQNANGALHLVYPTIKHLERLERLRDVAAAIEFARNKPVVTIMPGTSPAEGFVMPEALEQRW